MSRKVLRARVETPEQPTEAVTLKLPPGKTEADAIRIAKQHREIIRRTISGNEDKRLDQLVLACTAMCCGDPASGKRLAQLAIYA